ncbi:gamma-aminobutyric acid receptor subunit rho-2-like [Pocillopora damicornis]|uniref:gamma-aminobutyric acid receptor subunit rho-2-like n=1 Tax=Pocillopora damicornis TaxID=46731 RepID=UPI000F54E670|nr:gamma-aminobutyric acid receptor subunit rho-2-like [Pocillopora damicornis]
MQKETPLNVNVHWILRISVLLACLIRDITSSSVKQALVANYDETVRPRLFEGLPVEVSVQLHVESFGNIHEADMEFQVYSYFKQIWTDKRLAGRINRSITLKGSDINRVWTPDAYCYNARLTNLMLPDAETHSKVSISPDGVLEYSRGVSFTASCVMDLRSFPHDSQTCHLKFGSYAYDDSDVIFKWLSGDVHVSRTNMAQFKFLGAMFSADLDSYTGVNFTTITVSYTFQRRLGYYVLQVYIPDILIVLLSWIAFWMNPESAGDRLTIGITTILTIMFLSGAVNASMPPVSYAKAVDWYLITSFAFIFLSVIESLAAYVMFSRPVKKDSSFEKNSVKCRSLPSKLLPCLNSYRRKARAKKGKVPDEDKFNGLTMNMAVKDQSLPLSLEDIAYMEERERRESLIQQRKNNAVRIDRVSRILFPVAFVCYTVGYWISYS